MDTKLLENAIVSNEPEAEESQWRLQALFENARDAILMADEQMFFNGFDRPRV